MPESDLWNILVGHSRAVANYALEIVKQHPELNVDEKFVYEAAMLHDIGICKTSAPSIHCVGTYQYICHGYLGSEMLLKESLPMHALVCERHTGAGLSLSDIVANNLPIPHRDMKPQTTEEKLICYADKFFSKSRDLSTAKTIDEVVKSLQKYGEDQLQRFMSMHDSFSINV